MDTKTLHPLEPILQLWLILFHNDNNNNNIILVLQLIIMTTNHRNICRRRSKSDGGMSKEKAKDSVVSRSHSTFSSICTWLKKRKKVIGSHQSQSKDDALERSSSSLSTIEMNDQYRSSTSLKNLVDNDNDEAAMSVSEEDCPQPQSYDTDDADALDDSLSTVLMSELSLTSRHLVYEAMEYERLVRTQTVFNQKESSGIE